MPCDDNLPSAADVMTPMTHPLRHLVANGRAHFEHVSGHKRMRGIEIDPHDEVIVVIDSATLVSAHQTERGIELRLDVGGYHMDTGPASQMLDGTDALSLDDLGARINHLTPKET